MWPFSQGNDNVAEQVELYDTLIEEKQEQLDQLEGVENPNAEVQRDKLKEEVLQAKIQRSQVIENAERAGHDIKSYERD